MNVEDAIYDGEWLIALTPAGKYVGKKQAQDETGIRLGPVYEVTLMQVNQGGQPAVQRQLMPILLIPVDVAIGVGPDAVTINLSEFPASERDEWFRMVRNVRAGMQQLRAQRSGLHLPKGH